jgi:aryl-alcohol dehydrogenase-like predicted oxidoreductase
MPLFVWSSMAGGFMTGRFHRHNLHEFSAENDRLAIESYASEDNFQRLERAAALGAEKGLNVAQVALAYILSHPLNVFALIANRSGAELQENLAACDARLTDAEMGWLDLREA